MRIQKGKQYINKKHSTTYRVVGFANHSETLETLVLYERVDPEHRENAPWARPIELFKEKFKEKG